MYLLNRHDPSRAYEILEWKEAEGIVVLRGRYGVFDNRCDLRDPDIRAEWLLTTDMPQWIKEKEDAKLTRLQAGLLAGESDERCTGREAEAGSTQPGTPHPDEQGDGFEGRRPRCRPQDTTLEGW
jgi:hypothetical protein